MSKSLLCAAALSVVFFAPSAMAQQDASSPTSAVAATPASMPTHRDCRHDGDVVMTANGPAVCKKRPISDIHFYGKGYLTQVQDRAGLEH